MSDFDVIVIGSGITGGWAAKEFCEKGLKTLVIERGRYLDHPSEEYTDIQLPWEKDNRGLPPEVYDDTGNYAMLKRKGRWIYKNDILQFFVDDKEYPYSYPKDRPFMWTRGYQLGGRSITWGRQTYRWGPKDFKSNAKDGHGIAWPIGYEDLAPWYDHVESFAGICGAKDGLENLPDGEFLNPWPLNSAEKFVSDNINAAFSDRKMVSARAAHLTEVKPVHAELGRGQCQARSYCNRGCSYGAYFCSLSATLPAAQRTENLTIAADSIVTSIEYNSETNRAETVNVIDHNTRETRSYSARLIFVNASAIGSVQILLNSKSSAMPKGLGNSSGLLGHYIMDHFGYAGANGIVPNLNNSYEFGRKPAGIYIPNYSHESDGSRDFIRGYGFQGGARRAKTGHAGMRAGIGPDIKKRTGRFEDWRIGISVFGEMLPYKDNTATLHANKTDKWGIPQIHLDCHVRENERNMLEQARIDAEELLVAGGCINVKTYKTPDDEPILVGARTHEMGGACMGDDPGGSVLNKWCQSHDVPNLFVTDGAAMASCGTVNPSLTYMALTARAADYAVTLLKDGRL